MLVIHRSTVENHHQIYESFAVRVLFCSPRNEGCSQAMLIFKHNLTRKYIMHCVISVGVDMRKPMFIRAFCYIDLLRNLIHYDRKIGRQAIISTNHDGA